VVLMIISGITLALRSWESVMLTGSPDSLLSAAMGAFGSGVGLLILSALPRTSASGESSARAPDPPARAGVEAVERVGEALRDAPPWMILLGGFYIIIIIISAVALAYIDPIARTSAVTSTLAVIMLALGGISHMAYRTTNILPYSSDAVELRPHIAVIILMLLSIVGLIV